MYVLLSNGNHASMRHQSDVKTLINGNWLI